VVFGLDSLADVLELSAEREGAEEEVVIGREDTRERSEGGWLCWSWREGDDLRGHLQQALVLFDFGGKESTSRGDGSKRGGEATVRDTSALDNHKTGLRGDVEDALDGESGEDSFLGRGVREQAGGHQQRGVAFIQRRLGETERKRRS
jgi:hypothetical protein